MYIHFSQKHSKVCNFLDGIASTLPDVEGNGACHMSRLVATDLCTTLPTIIGDCHNSMTVISLMHEKDPGLP